MTVLRQLPHGISCRVIDKKSALGLPSEATNPAQVGKKKAARGRPASPALRGSETSLTRLRGPRAPTSPGGCVFPAPRACPERGPPSAATSARAPLCSRGGFRCPRRRSGRGRPSSGEPGPRDLGERFHRRLTASNRKPRRGSFRNFSGACKHRPSQPAKAASGGPGRRGPRPTHRRRSTPHTDGHSLCLKLTVKSQSRPGQPWCEVQGSVDTKPFLRYDSDSNKVKALGLLGEEVNATKAWTELSEMLREVCQELRMVLPVMKLEQKEPGGPPTLQVKLCCQREAERRTGASLHFNLSGQPALVLDAMSMNWTVLNPGATGIKEAWENNQELAAYFSKISMGDCGHWFREFLEHWENMLEPEPTEPLIKALDNDQSASIPSIAWIIPLIFSCLVLTGFIIMKLSEKSGTTAGEKQAGLWLPGRACSGKDLRKACRFNQLECLPAQLSSLQGVV
ncbi:retinoic acid early transcript 1E [Hippopotamus amphibius kiboko]|uniref:retinoic acid early transcript 1E n=1 Tax=Hippopotamus amphibius kiboko TaxID=575201 RepID=UPI002597EB06|nr:retinoic acid early transcript 1E [Hippopotamus amphibius kiboko]